MAVVYSVSSPVVTVVVRDPDEGQAIRIQFTLMRDGTTAVRDIDQYFGATKTNSEIRDELVAFVREVIDDDYRSLTQATILARCAAIKALLEGITKTMP